MSVLDLIKKARVLAPRITIYGLPGIGKSTLANQFPRPLFLSTEQIGLSSCDVIDPPKSFSEFWLIVKELCELDNPPFKTLIIDSISKLDQLVIDYVLDRDPKKENKTKSTNLATAHGGYGAGYQAAQQVHRAVKAKLDTLQSKGITVIYIGHLSTVKHKAPDKEDYDKYSIVMNHDKSREIYIDDVDCVAFCKLRSYTKESDSGRQLIVSTDERIIKTNISDAFVCKNRFNMPDEIPMDYNEFIKYIPFFNQLKEVAA